MKKHEEKKFSCRFCEYRCYRKDSMKSHESTHSDEKPYECKKCDYRGKSRQALNLHKRIHVSIEEFPYQCDICMKRFRQSPHYHTHMKMHLGIKPLKCQVCEYRTASRQNLKLHEQTHTKEEGKFQCLLCDKKFRRKFILDCHMVTHVEVNKDRFLCPLCDVTFSLKVLVQKHIRRMHRETLKGQNDTNDVLKCKLCSYQSLHKENMRDHLRTHSGERHVCQTCAKSFKDKYSLIRHIETLHISTELPAL